MAVHWSGLKVIQVGRQQLEPLVSVIITVEPEAPVAGMVVAGVKVLGARKMCVEGRNPGKGQVCGGGYKGQMLAWIVRLGFWGFDLACETKI
jgi:hypothetical protein